MNALARFWLWLVLWFTVGHGLLNALVWRSLDLRFEILMQHAVIPLLQAATLAWVVSSLDLGLIAAGFLHAFRRPWITGVWVLEAAWLLWCFAPFGGAGPVGPVFRSAGFAAVLAALMVVIRLPISPKPRFAFAVIPFSAFVILLGSNGFIPWIRDLPAWLPGAWPALLRQALCWSALLVALILLTGRASKAIAAENPVAAMLLSSIQPFVISAFLSLCLNGALYSFPAAPWAQMTAAALSLAAACLLSAALCLFGKGAAAQAAMKPSAEAEMHPLRLLPLWFVLGMSSLAGMVFLRLLLFREWAWEADMLLILVFVPLVQAAWLLWARALRFAWRDMRALSGKMAAAWAGLLAEASLLSYLTFAGGPWQRSALLKALAIWVGFKLALSGAGLLWGAGREKADGRLLGVLGLGAFALGLTAAVVAMLGSPSWLIAVSGSAFAWAAAHRRMDPAAVGERFCQVTAQAGFLTLLTMAGCAVLVGVELLAPAMPAIWFALALAISFLWVGSGFFGLLR